MRTFLAQRCDEIRAEAPTAPDLRQAILDRHDALVPTDDVPLLADECAPTVGGLAEEGLRGLVELGRDGLQLGDGVPQRDVDDVVAA